MGIDDSMPIAIQYENLLGCSVHKPCLNMGPPTLRWICTYWCQNIVLPSTVLYSSATEDERLNDESHCWSDERGTQTRTAWDASLTNFFHVPGHAAERRAEMLRTVWTHARKKGLLCSISASLPLSQLRYCTPSTTLRCLCRHIALCGMTTHTR